MWQPATLLPGPGGPGPRPELRQVPARRWPRWSGSATGLRWAEGPVWFGDARHLLVSDIPNNRIVKWDEETGQLSNFRRPSNYANGNTRDRAGAAGDLRARRPPGHADRA